MSCRPLVVMGVTSSGKSLVGRALAAATGAPFVDADDLHPPTNIAKMSEGVPLDDDDRRPWLDAVAAVIAGDDAPVVACSALKRRYRNHLRRTVPDLRFVHLDGPPSLIAERMAARRDHFMPASLLTDQISTLEPLEPDEDGVVVSIDAAVDDIVVATLDALGR